MGISTGIFLAALGISGIKEQLKREDSKKRTLYLKNGTPYYMHNGKTYLYDGTQIIVYSSGDVTDIHGKIIYNRSAELLREVEKNKAKQDDRDKQEAIERGWLYYYKRVPTCGIPVHVEISTGKVIAKIWRKQMPDGTYECRKWYWYDKLSEEVPYDMLYDKFGNKNFIPPNEAYRIRKGDPGIIISEEEFEKMCGGDENFYRDDKKNYDFQRRKWELADRAIEGGWLGTV